MRIGSSSSSGLRAASLAAGLANLAGGWRGSEELVRLLAGSRRSLRIAAAREESELYKGSRE